MDNVIATHDDPLRKHLNTQKLTPTNLSQAYTEGQLKYLPMEPDASEIIWKLSDKNHHIKIIVNRFITDGLNHKVVTHTTDWLDRHDIPYREILFITQPVPFVTDVFIGNTFHRSIPENALHIPYQTLKPSTELSKWETIYQKIKTVM